MRPCSLSTAAILALLLGTAARAVPQPSSPTPTIDSVLEGPHDPSVPTPRDVLGFSPGERAARHAEIVRFAEALAAASPRVSLLRHGRSHEGRELVLLVISSESRLASLEQDRADLRRLADPRVRLSEADLGRVAGRTPVVALLAYSIHGDEFSGADAALHLAWHLATSSAPAAQAIRENVVTLVDPLENPDGRDRVLAMTSAFASPFDNPDPDSLAHQGSWPWGRTNHYLFDLNRDWLSLVHPESRARAAVLAEWQPHLVADVHEMGPDSTHLFNPPRAPFNPHLPSTMRAWWDRFSADQARAFDARGWSYFSGEWNEEFFPGYGSALPLYTGAVGILHEQAGTDAQVVRKPHGALFRYEEAVARQLTSSLANLATAAAHREEILRSHRLARAEAVDRGARGRVGAYVFGPGPDAGRAARLARRIAELGLEVERAGEPFTARGLHRVADGRTEDVALPAGAFRVRLDQPAGLLAAVMLAPHVPMADSFLAEEREHLERQKGSRIYDTTAWSPLLASGLDAWWAGPGEGGPWSRAETIDAPAGGVAPGEARYGHVWDGATDAALGLAAELAAAGHVVRCGEKPIVVGQRQLARGSFLLRAEDNPGLPAARLAEMAAARGVLVLPVASARPARGPARGGATWPPLVAPRIAIVAGSPTDPGSVGFAWHLVEKEVGLRVSLVEAVRLASVDVDRYNVIVLPDAWGGGYERALGAAGLEALARWVESGGTLVGIGSGAELLASESSKLSAVRTRAAVLKDHPPPRLGLDAGAIRALERMQATGLPEDGQPVTPAGAWTEEAWPAALGIPGPGSPLLGSGARKLLGLREPATKTGGSKAAKEADEEKGDGAKESEEQAKAADERLRRFLPSGAFVRVDMDTEHWLGSGVSPEAFVLARGEEQLVAADPVRTVGRFADPERLHLGGLLWPEAAGRIAQTAWLTREGHGRGQVILFESDPNFRGMTWDTQRAFLNAVILGPGLGASRPLPW